MSPRNPNLIKMEQHNVENTKKRRRINLTECCRNYFEKLKTITTENGDKKTFYSCKLCEGELNGTYESNLVKHLQKKHTNVFGNIGDNDEQIDKKRLKLLLDCVELVSVNGNAFNRLLDSGLHSILDKTLQELEAAGKALNLKDPHLVEVKDMLDEMADSVKQKIRDEIADRPLSLMIDGTKKRRRSILGASVQLIKNGKHIIRSIGMLQLEKKHTGEYFANVICDLILDFNIKPAQIIAITTDNGGNAVKMVRDIPARIQQTNICDVDIESYLRNVPEYTDEEALARVFASDDEEDVPEDICDNLLDAVVRNIQNQEHSNWDIQGIRCAAHTLQLAIGDALGKLDEQTKNIITLCRRVAKFLRLDTTANELKADGLEFSVPRLDVETRWCSTYNMVHGTFFY